ncbi:unnamed protein product [Lepeophtheirus salmonis]|uniref:(salmon louse) hypothetical protein n=2 Tax=Lepeophtheirus salmonis TaxID=72036 RepID=A0A7R8CB07_LEPSM|nr:unnamed protein product [Lepeophtheirus salmonis]CAF2756179.1 unnamed protein product [Lepeophtheirus salmonis]
MNSSSDNDKSGSKCGNINTIDGKSQSWSRLSRSDNWFFSHQPSNTFSSSSPMRISSKLSLQSENSKFFRELNIWAPTQEGFPNDFRCWLQMDLGRIHVEYLYVSHTATTIILSRQPKWIPGVNVVKISTSIKGAHIDGELQARHLNQLGSRGMVDGDDVVTEALKHYESSNDFKKAYLETAMLFKIFRKFWNCVNVNSLISSIKLRDERMPPITHENREQIDFLLSLYTWLKSQQDMSLHKKGLSSETFLAALQTSRGLDELSNYLLNETEANIHSFTSLRDTLLNNKMVVDSNNIQVDKTEFLRMISNFELSNCSQVEGVENILCYIGGYISYAIFKKGVNECCRDLLGSSIDLTILIYENVRNLKVVVHERMSAFHRVDFGEIVRNRLPKKDGDSPTYKIFNISLSSQIKTQLESSPLKGLENFAYQLKFTNLISPENAKDKRIEKVFNLPLPPQRWTEGALRTFSNITDNTISLLDYPSPLHYYARSLIAAYVIYKVLRKQGAAIATSEGELLSISPEGNLEINIDKMLKDLNLYKIFDYVEFNIHGDSNSQMSS